MVLMVKQDGERDARLSERATLEAEQQKRGGSLHWLPEVVVEGAEFWGAVGWWRK